MGEWKSFKEHGNQLQCMDLIRLKQTVLKKREREIIREIWMLTGSEWDQRIIVGFVQVR